MADNNYENISNKPSINGVTLTSNLDLSDIGLIEMTPEMVKEICQEIFGVIL